MSVILFDAHNLAFRTLFVPDVEINTPNPNFQLWKYMMINSVYESLYRVDNTTEVILAVDDTKSWRSLYFPRYKESRKIQREKKEDIDWQYLFKTLNDFYLEIKEHLPFKVLKVQNSEADDIIAILCKEILKEPKHIISNDEDFLQLCSENDVILYNPSKKEVISCENPEMFVIEKSLLGQKKDDIFNIKTPSDWGLTPETQGKKKPGFGPAALEKTLIYGWEKWIKDNNYEDNFKRNRVLIDFNYIPKSIRSNIRKAYETYEFPEPENIYKFFKNNGFTGFLEDFTKVEKRLLELY